MRSLSVLCALSALTLVACDDGDPDPVDSGVADTGVVSEDADVMDEDSGTDVDAGPGELVVPDTYAFESRFSAGESSIRHTGQTARHLLISDLKDYVGGLTAEVDGGFSPAADGDVTARLEYFFSLDGGDRADDPFRLSTDPAALQSTYGDISSANLIDKVAGNDSSTDHRDWSTEFAGWSDASIAAHGGGIDSPTNLVRAFFETLEENAIDRAAGRDRLSPALQPLPVHVTESGLDLQQLTEKFLLGALAFSQAADDYTDDDTDGKGLLVDNTMPASDGAPYTALEHVWDEAWGYYGGRLLLRLLDRREPLERPALHGHQRRRRDRPRHRVQLGRLGQRGQARQRRQRGHRLHGSVVPRVPHRPRDDRALRRARRGRARGAHRAA